MLRVVSRRLFTLMEYESDWVYLCFIYLDVGNQRSKKADGDLFTLHYVLHNSCTHTLHSWDLLNHQPNCQLKPHTHRLIA